jgi:hypothetical protein
MCALIFLEASNFPRSSFGIGPVGRHELLAPLPSEQDSIDRKQSDSPACLQPSRQASDPEANRKEKRGTRLIRITNGRRRRPAYFRTFWRTGYWPCEHCPIMQLQCEWRNRAVDEGEILG